MPSEVTLNRLAVHLEQHGAEVLHAQEHTLSQMVVGLIARKGWHRLVSVRRNRVGHPSVLGDDPLLSDEELAGLDAVITESTLAVSEIGAVVLDHGAGQGRPSLTSIPHTHVCVVEGDRVVDTVQEARECLDLARPATWIAGPSAPPDLVDGLHRPDSLIVVLVAS